MRNITKIKFLENLIPMILTRHVFKIMILNNFQKVFIIIKHSYIIKYVFKDLNIQVYQIFSFQTFFYVESSKPY